MTGLAVFCAQKIVDFVGAKDSETSHLPRSFRIWDGLGVSSRR